MTELRRACPRRRRRRRRPRAGRGPRRRRRRHHARHRRRRPRSAARRPRARARTASSPGCRSPRYVFETVGQGRLRVEFGTRRRRAGRAGRGAGHRPRPGARPAHRRAHRAEPARPPVRRRHAHPALGRRGRGHRRAHPRHPQDHARACARWRSTRCAAAAASTTACRCRTPRWSRTTTSSPPAASSRRSSWCAPRYPGPAARDRGRHASSRPARSSTPAPTSSCSTTWRRPTCAAVVDVRGRPGPARGVRRAAARQRARGGRDRRRLPCSRRADPLGAGARHRAGHLEATGRHAARDRHRQHQHRPRRLRRRRAAQLVADQDRRPQHRRRAGADLPRPARRHPEITGIAACSTVPAVLRELRTMLDALLPATCRPCSSSRACAPASACVTDNPKEVGTDRICNTAAAHHLVDGPCIVVDFGTSTNFDVVSARGDFLGGALAPGIEISLDALAARAAQLRKVELVAPRSPIGKNTVEALQSGILYGFAGQVDGMVRRLSRRARARRPGVGRGHRHRRAGHAGHRPQRDGHPLRARPHPARPAPDLRAQRLT